MMGTEYVEPHHWCVIPLDPTAYRRCPELIRSTTGGSGKGLLQYGNAAVSSCMNIVSLRITVSMRNGGQLA